MMRSLALLVGVSAASAQSPVTPTPPTENPATTQSPTHPSGLSNEVIGVLFQEFDTDNNNQISPEEFQAYLGSVTGATAVACAIGDVTCTVPTPITNTPVTDAPYKAGQPSGAPSQCQCLPWDTCVNVPCCCNAEPTAAPSQPGDTSPPQSSVGGDPFTSFRGKQTQFYLPLGKEEPLITCDGMELRGEAFGSGIKGDTQQWFKTFGIAFGGEDLLHVSVQNMTTMTQVGTFGKGSLPAAASARARAAKLLADAAAAMVAEEHPDVSVSQVIETRVSAALQAMHWAESFRGGSYPKAVAGEMSKPLTSLNVTVEGRQISTTGAQTVRRGDRDVFFAITQDSAIHIGQGYSETVSFGSGHVGFELSSALAQKYDGTKAVEKTHIDLRFTQLNVSECTGVLPEIWGVQPMTKLSAAMLVPPKV